LKDQKKKSRSLASLGMTALFAACFQYNTTAPGTVVPAGQSVRLDLTDAGRVAVAPMAGEGVDRIEGIVDIVQSDTIQLQVTSLRRRDIAESWTRERLKVAARDVTQVSQRRFSPTRTALLIGAIALGASTVRLGTSDSFLGGRKSGTTTSGGR
jgi:hypothetical protein